MKKTSVIVVGAAAAVGVVGISFGKKIKIWRIRFSIPRIYVNPSNRVIIVKTGADPDFMEKGYELKHVEFFRAIADSIA